MLLLEQDTIKKGRVDKNVTKFEAGSNDKQYEVKRIWDSAVYVKESATGHFASLYL